MTSPLDPTWTPRDLPVLREAIRTLDETNAPASIEGIAEALNMEVPVVLTAARALEGDNLVTLRFDRGRMADMGHIMGASGEARRRVGTWPSPEDALERMIAALEGMAEKGATPDTRSRAAKLRDALLNAGTQVGVGVATAAITGQLPT